MLQDLYKNKENNDVDLERSIEMEKRGHIKKYFF